jgi:hypothetical protein
MVARDFSFRFAPFEMTIAGKVYGEEGNGKLPGFGAAVELPEHLK